MAERTDFISDLEAFIQTPSDRVRVGEIENPPSLEIIRMLPRLTYEIGMVRQENRWFVIKTPEDYGIPAYLMKKNAQVLLHSHPEDEDEVLNDQSFPSLSDFYNCPSSPKNFIVSVHGITRFFPVMDEYKGMMEAEFLKARFIRGSKEIYLKFLKLIEAKHAVTSWEYINQEFLDQNLYFEE